MVEQKKNNATHNRKGEEAGEHLVTLVREDCYLN